MPVYIFFITGTSLSLFVSFAAETCLNYASVAAFWVRVCLASRSLLLSYCHALDRGMIT